jgi:hypothetical protein
MIVPRDSGKGALKALLSLAFLALVIFCAFKIIAAVVDNYELQEFLDSVAVQATVQSPPMTAEAVQDEILAKTGALGLPVERKDIKVSISRAVRIDLDYMVYVDLKFYTVPLHFTPSAENGRIT